MNALKYLGPVSTLIIAPAKYKKDGSLLTEEKTELLMTDKIYKNLPQDNPQVCNLIAHDLLIDVEDETIPPQSNEKTKTTTGARV